MKILSASVRFETQAVLSNSHASPSTTYGNCKHGVSLCSSVMGNRPWYLMPSDQLNEGNQSLELYLEFLELTRNKHKGGSADTNESEAEICTSQSWSWGWLCSDLHWGRSLWNGAVMLPGGHKAHFARVESNAGSCVYPLISPVNCTRWSGEALSSTSPCSLEIQREGEMGQGKEEERCGLWVNKSLA